nr:MFS transporter [Micromonospora sp. DSM 115978]
MTGRVDGDAVPGASGGSGSLGVGYRWLWSSSALSNLADGVVKVGLPLVAIRYTESPALIAGLMVALTLPWLVFALPAGALADRLDRRRAMIGANTVRATLLGVLALAVVADLGSIWLLYLVGFAIGATETVYDTSAQSILPQLVPRGLLSRANGRLHAAELTAHQFVGPPLAGFLVVAGAAVAFVGPAAAWAVAVVALLPVRGRFRVERDRRTTIRADIAEGLRFLWRHKLLRTLGAMVGGMNFVSNAVFGILVLYAVGPDSAIGLTEPAYGVLLTTAAIGIVLGSLLAARIERWLGRVRALGLSVVCSATFVAVLAVTTNPYAIGVVFFLSGVGIATWNVITVSLRQRITPDRLLGRLNSGYRMLAWGTMPLGAVTGGVLAELLGLRAVFVIMTILGLALLAGMIRVTEATITAAERAAAEGDPHGG